MIITHMPTKVAVATGLAIAVVLGVCSVLYMVMAGGGAWRVYQGEGREVKGAGGGTGYFSAKTEGGRAGRWFEFRGLTAPAERGSEGSERYAVTFTARTRTGFSGTVEVGVDGEVYERKLALEPTEEWVRVVLPLAGFRRRASGTEETEQGAGMTPRRVGVGELGPVVSFVIGANGEGAEGTRGLVLEVSRPRLERIVTTE